jgi:hypothetical protein
MSLLDENIGEAFLKRFRKVEGGRIIKSNKRERI